MLRYWITTGSRAILLSLTLSLLLLAACGGDDDEDDDPTASSTDTSSVTSTTSTGFAGSTATSEQDDDDDADDEETDGNGPCSLLSEGEVAAAVGEDVLGTDAIGSDDSNLGNCSYSLAPEGSFKVVSVFNYGPFDPSTLAIPTDAQAIEGLGEEAHWDPALSILYVRYDDESYFSVQIAKEVQNEVADLEAARELAAKILERL